MAWRRLAAGAAVVAIGCGLLGCGPAATPTAIASPAPSQPPVIQLPTQLPDEMSLDQTLPLFEYDRQAPFAVRVVSSYPRGNATLADISYMGANGLEEPAYLVTPAGKGPFAAVIWMGWTGDYAEIRKEFVDEAMALAEHGVVSLLVSGYFPWRVKPLDKDSDRMALIGQIRDLRRALDLLISQPGVDPARVGFVGHSMGAMHGVILSAIDQRVKAAVLIAPDSIWADWIFEGYGLAPQLESVYRTAMASFDPLAYVGLSRPASLFFQFGSTDQFVSPDVARTLYAAASEPKRIGWYTGGHDLDAAAGTDRTAWLETELSLNP